MKGLQRDQRLAPGRRERRARRRHQQPARRAAQAYAGQRRRSRQKLESFSDVHRRFGYTIVGGVLPVRDYHCTLRVVATGKDPAADANDKAATTAIGGVYKAGLGNLKKMLETK